MSPASTFTYDDFSYGLRATTTPDRPQDLYGPGGSTRGLVDVDQRPACVPLEAELTPAAENRRGRLPISREGVHLGEDLARTPGTWSARWLRYGHGATGTGETAPPVGQMWA
jgi:hypothetical protein